MSTESARDRVLNLMHHKAQKVIDTLIEADVTLPEASYILQIVQQELVEQGFTPNHREAKIQRQMFRDNFSGRSKKPEAISDEDKASQTPCKEDAAAPQ